MKISDILRSKGAQVITVHPDRPVQEALRMLVDHNIGALLVVDERVRGIISERDVLRHAATDIVRLQSARVSDLMTANVITATPQTEINDVMNVMVQRGIRHLPVLAGDEICGMISMRDVINALRQDAETEKQQLHAYITGTSL